MNWKVKQYESFSGEYLRLKIEVSSVIVDRLSDDMKMTLRNRVVGFEQELFNFLKYEANEILGQQTEPVTPQEDEQTDTETKPETKPETNPETAKKSGKSNSIVQPA